jgi:hypothetical protein
VATVLLRRRPRPASGGGGLGRWQPVSVQVAVEKRLLLRAHRNRQARVRVRRLPQELLHLDLVPLRIVEVHPMRVIAHDQADPPIGVLHPPVDLVIALIHHHHIPILEGIMAQMLPRMRVRHHHMHQMQAHQVNRPV